jgi:hemimethylated DNA binding protein
VPAEGDQGGAPGWQRERSAATAQELVLVCLEQELSVASQRALNNESYEAAKVAREQQERVSAILRERTSRGGRVSRSVVEAELVDSESSAGHSCRLLTPHTGQARCAVLRSQLDTAVREERYREAAGLRDALAAAEVSLVAVGSASVGDPEFAFALGQRVTHARWGWTGAVAGCEPVCSETEEWAAQAGVNELPRGREQPFYVVLPDPVALGGSAEVLYVAEDSLLATPPLPAGADKPGLDHPLAYVAFLGSDAVGGYVPSRALRERWAQPRRDVWPAAEPDDESGDAALFE